MKTKQLNFIRSASGGYSSAARMAGCHFSVKSERDDIFGQRYRVTVETPRGEGYMFVNDATDGENICQLQLELYLYSFFDENL